MIIYVKNATEALARKDELTNAGLIVHYDYTWCYHPLIEDYSDLDNSYPPRVEFNFVDSKWTTYFQLKWA